MTTLTQIKKAIETGKDINFKGVQVAQVIYSSKSLNGLYIYIRLVGSKCSTMALINDIKIL